MASRLARASVDPTTTARDRPPEEAPEDTSFARGLRVFLAIADRGLVRADELATLLETPLSTVYRYLRTLTEFGFVDRHDGAYRLGPRLLVGGGSTVSTEELIRHADPILAMLAAESGETAIISRRVGLAAVCLHEQPSDQALRIVLEPGGSSALGVGALGRVLLAYAPPDIQDEVLAATSADLVSDLAAVVAERHRGHRRRAHRRDRQHRRPGPALRRHRGGRRRHGAERTGHRGMAEADRQAGAYGGGSHQQGTRRVLTKALSDASGHH